MKVTRKMLLIITTSLGVFIIVYSLIRQFTGFGLSEETEKYLFDIIIIAALGCFMYNRKIARDERLAKEASASAAAEAERRAAEEQGEEISSEDENLPHWERGKNHADKDDAEADNENADNANANDADADDNDGEDSE